MVFNFIRHAKSDAEHRMIPLEGNRQKLDGGAMFGNVPRAMWQKWEEPDEFGRIELACRCLLIKVGGLNVLLETGVGAFFPPKLASRFGVESGGHRLLQSLAEHQIQASDIDYIILSHVHFDHAGGLLSEFSEDEEKNGKIVFENAKIVVSGGAWERATNAHSRDRASYPDQIVQPLRELANSRLIVVEEGQSLPSELSQLGFGYFLSEGHTPAQMHTVFTSQKGTQYIFAGDLIPGKSWTHKSITMGYDRFAERVIDEKSELYKSIGLDKTVFFFTHDPKCAFATIYADEKGRFRAEEYTEM